jgi:sporulation-control protein
MGILSRIGVGSATVDAILETETVRPGDTIDAHVEIEGGNDEQEVDELELAVVVQYQVPTEEDGVSYVTEEIAETELAGFTIHPDTDRRIDVPPIEVPPTAPATIDQTDVWIETTLEIDWSTDPSDRDDIEVLPAAYLDALLTAVENLGLQLEYADATQSHFGPHDFAQFFEYEDYGGTPWHDLDDLEFSVVPGRDYLDVRMTIEESGRSFLGSDESGVEFTVDSTDPDEVEREVRSVVDRNL